MAEKLTISSHKELLIEQLKEIAPYLFLEGEINPDLVKQHLLDVEPKQEQYSFNWVGKSKAIKTLQRKTLSLLIPNIGKSINFEKTKNVFIEGDNLEILKILQQSYFEEVDLIYIDPPYNTDKDFVYSDKYEDSLQTYLEYAGLIGSSASFSNETTTGRKHSNWLSMMYPRLVLAKNLLKNTGVIAISIDEHEISNLVKIGEEVFGEENIDILVWNKISDEGSAGQGKMKVTLRVRNDHEYVALFYKNKKETKFNKPLRLKTFKNEYGNTDNDHRGDWISCEICKSEEKSNKVGVNYFSVDSPTKKTFSRQWHVSKEEFEQLDKDKRIYWGKGESVPRLKKFILEPQPTTPCSVLTNITQTSGNNLLKQLFPETEIILFDNPKPLNLIGWLIEITTNKDGVILDFFAGSGSTGHSLYNLNKEDGGSRKYILVQLDEIPNFSTTKEDKEKKRVFDLLGIKVISDLTVERLKRAGKLYPNIDTGFRFFSLPKQLPLQPKDLTSIEGLQALELAVKKYSSKEEILTEMLLKKGLLLSSELIKHNDWIYSTTKDDKTVYMCILEKDICLPQIEEISKTIKDKSKCEVIFIESAFSVEGKLNAINLLEKQQGISIGLI